jgi:hypothetical protein
MALKSSHGINVGGTKQEDGKFNLPIGDGTRDSAMEQSDTRSLQQLKRETEETRANLMDTVEQLRATVSESASDIRQRIQPEAIKTEVSQYFRTRGEQLLDNAKRNPMQAVAVGATVGYPLLRLARAIPLPLWMMGAGLFFASSKTGQSLTQKAADAASDFSNSVAQRSREISDRAADAASAAKSLASEATSLASEKVTRLTDAVANVTNSSTGNAGASLASGSEQLQERVTSLGAAVSDASANISGQVRQTGSSAAANVRDMASDAASAGRRAVEAGRNMGLQAARNVQETASNFGERAGKTFFETIEQNPLLVAGVGLFIGGIIASAIPRSDVEDSMIGGASNSVKRGADQAAAGAVRTAKAAVGESYEEAVRQAQAEGLTPEGLGETARNVGERLRHVAEAAVTTAFEPTQNGNEHQQRSTQGETDHG